MQELTVVKTQETSWRRVDTTTAVYRPFGKIVQDLGGWGDALAIAGATKGCSKCLILGPPWWRIHPQTEMLEFIILEGSWEETFSKKWTECKSHMMADAGSQPPIAGPSKQLAPPPSSSGEPASAAAGQGKKGKQRTHAGAGGPAAGADTSGARELSAAEKKKAEQEKQRMAKEKAEKAPIANVIHADIMCKSWGWAEGMEDGREGIAEEMNQILELSAC